MARYYFDIGDSLGFHRDEIGETFFTSDEAKDQAHTLLPDIVREELSDGKLHIVTCDVRDDTGRFIYRGTLTYEGTCDPA